MQADKHGVSGGFRLDNVDGGVSGCKQRMTKTSLDACTPHGVASRVVLPLGNKASA
jgi:hypothetical protein